MAYRFDPTAPINDEVRRIACERVDAAVDWLSGEGVLDAEEAERAIHEARKCCKEARALARLMRSDLGDRFTRFNSLVGEAADQLSAVRDAHAVLGAIDDMIADRAIEDDAEVATVRAAQAALADDETRSIAEGDKRVKRACKLLRRARRQIEGWDDLGSTAWLGRGVGATYRRGRRDLARVVENRTDDAVHDWRKSVKRLWYQVRLIEDIAPSALTPLIATLDDLGEALGDDHDLAVLIGQLSSDRKAFGGKRAAKHTARLARTEQAGLRERTFRLGATVYAESTDAFVSRLETYWHLAITLGPEPTND